MRHFLKRFIPLFGLVFALSACATPPTTEEASFEVQLITRSLQIVQGSSFDFVVQLNRNGFTDPITVTASELPAGVTAGAVTTTGSTATLRFLAAADAVQGDSKSFTIFATAGGKTSQAVTTSLSVRGAPGALDTTFGGGRVTFPSNQSIQGAALAPDGGIFLLLSRFNFEGFTLVKLTADGRIDPNFIGRFDLAPRSDRVSEVVVQPDGKIVLGILLEITSTETNFGVVRLTSRGELDTSFSGDGIAAIAGVRSPSVDALTLTPDGSIVVAGSMINGTDTDFLVARFDQNGQPNLGSSGFITDSFGASGDSAKAVAVTPNGLITVAGQAQLNIGDRKFILARYRSDGSKDTSFGQSGHVTVEFNDDISRAAARALALQPDGKIIAVGFAENSAFSGIGVTRLLSNGQVDTSFGNRGEVILDFEPSRISGDGMSVVLEPSGRIVLADTAFHFNNSSNDFALARLEANGKLDLTFGNGGRQTTDFGGTRDRVTTLLRTSNGRLLLVGSNNNELLLARYWP